MNACMHMLCPEDHSNSMLKCSLLKPNKNEKPTTKKTHFRFKS